VKQGCYFDQFIAINDNQSSNLPDIYVRSRQVKHTGEIEQVGGREKQRERIRGERDVALVKWGNGLGRNDHW
jgi:hypothetical protein